MNTELAIVVLNYRTPALTVACLASLEAEIDHTVRVLVVDNASGDDSVATIQSAIAQRGWSHWAQVLEAPVNGGFAAGNAIGIRAIHAEAYLLLNSDTVVRPQAVARLREALRLRPDVGLVGPALLKASGARATSSFREIAPTSELLRSASTGLLGRWLGRFEVALPHASHPTEPDWIAFACVLIRRAVIEQVGMLDDGYFMYFEDVDYCRRARAHGWSVLCWPDAEVTHFSGASSKVTATATQKARAPRYYYEARARYYAKFYGRRGLWLANGMWHLGRCISWTRERWGSGVSQLREREAFDIWINALDPLGHAR